ncbi:hypothetical protein Tco_0584101 [Tanacetum coccineum]
MSSDTNCWILDIITQSNGIRVPYLLISHPVRKYCFIYLEILILGDKSHDEMMNDSFSESRIVHLFLLLVVSVALSGIHDSEVSGRVFLVDGEPKLLHIYLWNIYSDEDSEIAGSKSKSIDVLSCRCEVSATMISLLMRDPNIHFVESPALAPPEVMIDMEAPQFKNGPALYLTILELDDMIVNSNTIEMEIESWGSLKSVNVFRHVRKYLP